MEESESYHIGGVDWFEDIEYIKKWMREYKEEKYDLKKYHPKELIVK